MCDREDLLAPERLSEYVQRQFEAVGLADIAARVSQGDPLELEDTQRLANAPLPLLAKLVSLQPNHEPCDCPAVDPVVHLAPAEWLTSADPEAAISKAAHVIQEAASQLAAFIEQDERVRDFGRCIHTLHVVVDVPENPLLDSLKAAVKEISNDTERAGVSVSLRIPQSTGTERRDADTSSYTPEDIQQWSGQSRTADETQAAVAMRSVALARLTSSEDAQIRAPVGRLGIKTAHVGLSFGANHLGQVAVNAETAAALRIPTLAELADALRYDTATPV